MYTIYFLLVNSNRANSIITKDISYLCLLTEQHSQINVQASSFQFP